jgi:hypothetical protein
MDLLHCFVGCLALLADWLGLLAFWSGRLAGTLAGRLRQLDGNLCLLVVRLFSLACWACWLTG